MKSYRRHVVAQSEKNPCLSSLCKFLDDPNSSRHVSQIATLDFIHGKAEPLFRRHGQDDLYSIIAQHDSSEKTGMQGQILLIEDISAHVLEALGTLLDIDPLFFTSYISGADRSANGQTPELALLPSRTRRQNYLNVWYHRAIVVQKPSDQQQKLLRDMNISRKVVILPTINDTTVGLVQHSCAVLKHVRDRGSWLYLVLVDPIIEEHHLVVRLQGSTSRVSKLASRLFSTGYEDFVPSPSLWDEPQPAPSRLGLIDDLAYYWRRDRPENFNSIRPTLLSICYYPLKIVAAEWTSYIAIMTLSTKSYEYRYDESRALPQELDKLNSDLRALQTWRRRSFSSQQKIASVKRFLSLQGKTRYGGGTQRGRQEQYDNGDESHQPRSSSDADTLLEDYNHLSSGVASRANLLESMVPVVTSLIQIVDSRRSFAETANITRLTYLALVFVPLTFTSSLFSMNAVNAPGNEQFWVFIVVAVPMTVAVFLLARVRWERLGWLWVVFKRGASGATILQEQAV